ncbi:MAG: hypothetical protein GF307_01325 [candidate division Zixibacteria bacterium]|nr:hypothetical protein [candidate division Zixibacteria bacterium]
MCKFNKLNVVIIGAFCLGLFLFSSVGYTATIEIVDFVSDRMEAGRVMHSILEENGYSVGYSDTVIAIPDDMSLLIANFGLAGHGHWTWDSLYLDEDDPQLELIRECGRSGIDMFVIGFVRLLNLPPHTWLGVGHAPCTTYPSDSIRGLSGFMEGKRFSYSESDSNFNSGSICPSGFGSGWENLIVYSFFPWTRHDGVSGIHPEYGYKAYVIVSDPAMIENHPGFDTREDFVLTPIRDFFGLTPTSVPENNTPLPDGYRLYQSHPNPFNASTNIRFRLPRAGEVEMGIYNLMGQEIRTLFSGKLPLGDHMLLWDGTDNSGNEVASGIYFYRLSGEKFELIRRMTLLK